MNEDLDDAYFTWLELRVGRQGPRLGTTHWELLRQLYRTEFVWLVPNDDNRIADGLELRQEFLSSGAYRHIDLAWLDMPCSVLEMMLGLARHLSFQADGEVGEWFWHMIKNLDLAHCSDRRYDPDYVEEILTRLVYRNYSPDGSGGLFPLDHPREDQTDVELWYQLSAYILELN